MCTRAIHSMLFRALPRSIQRRPSVAKGLLHAIDPTQFGLPHTAINTFLVIRYLTILSTCPNRLNTLLSVLLALPIYSSSHTHLFIPNSIQSWHSNQTYQTLHSRTFTFLLLALLAYRHIRVYPQSSIAQQTLQCSPRFIPLIHSVCHIAFTSSISYHLRPQVLKTIYFH